MNDLNLGGNSENLQAAPAPVDPNFKLEAPEPIPEVPEEQAISAIAVSDEARTALQEKASAFIAELAEMDMKAPEFALKINSITMMGAADIRRSSEVSNRMLSRPTMQEEADNAQSRVGKTLLDLRTTITALDPNRADLTGMRKLFKWLPGTNRVESYFAKYKTAQNQLDDIIRSLASGQDELRKDNAAIAVERKALWETMTKLGEYNELATALEQAVRAKISDLQDAGHQEDAKLLEADVLFAIRQRHQDIHTQMAVSVQGYLALDLIRKNNGELIRGVDRAQTTTISALRTAVITSQALSQQKLVLDQIAALNTTTSELIERTSTQLREQGAEIHHQAANSTIEVHRLQNAFDNVFATMDAIDTFRIEANDAMAQTITTLSAQIHRSTPYLHRSRNDEQRELSATTENPPEITS